MRNTRVARDLARKAITDLSHLPNPGDKIHGFTLLRTKQLPELELTALHLQHDKTGAQHVHVARDDSNNVFSIGFKTNPPDDTGVPHILEHTALCGSDRYPIRDPFFKMLPRTLSNFMNAFTATDHTYYPFATTNRKDFSNLMAVYLDATLHPLLNEYDFIQEGWRIGPQHPEALAAAKAAQATPDADHARLVFKGVVYNEMKGAMSDASTLYSVRFQDHIFPAIHNSGGDPRRITDLTYAQLKKFHAEHYHPSNARLFTYGDMPLADHLRDVGAQLDAFDRMPQDTVNHEPISLSSGPQEVTLLGPVDPLVDPNKQFKTSVSWVLGDTSNLLESFSMAMVSALLMDGYGSPLYKGLIETNLGTDWSPNAGYDGSAKRAIFSIGLTGVQEADVPRIKSEVHKILQAVRQKGFERMKIDGYLHQLELALKHKTAQFGVSLLHRLKSKWFSGTNPLDSLTWTETVTAFEAELAKGDYLGGLMDKYLLNDNTLTFTMAPSDAYGQELAEEEKSRLQAKIAQAAELAGGREKAQAQFEAQELQLQAEQAKSNTESLDCLPSVHVQDIPRQKPESSQPRLEKLGAASVQWQEVATNGLTYFRAILNLENLPDKLRAMIPLFTDAIMAIGTKDTTMEQLEDLIKLKTGGVSFGYFSTARPTDFTQATEGLSFGGTAFDRNVPAMFDLVRKLVLETDFDSPKAVQRVRQLLQSSADGVVNSIASSGHAYARRVAEAGLTRSAYLSEQVSGLTQVKLVASLASRPDSDSLSDVLDELKQIQAFALTGNLRVALTCDSHSAQANEKALSGFLDGLPSDAAKFAETSQASVLSSSIKTFYPLPYQVYYGGLAVPTASYTSADGAPLAILARLLTHKHLHHEIREKGGAYGGGAYARAVSGLFGFYSYRDPNPVGTLRIMGGAGRWAAERAWAARDLEEAKISVFQGVDAPRAASDEGMDLFLHGIDDVMRQRRREQLLDVTADQVRDVARRYLVDALAAGAGRTAFLGEKKDWVDASWAVEDMDINDGGVD